MRETRFAGSVSRLRRIWRRAAGFRAVAELLQPGKDAVRDHAPARSVLRACGYADGGT